MAYWRRIKSGTISVTVEGGQAPPSNPITKVDVKVPSKVQAGQQFAVVIEVYATRKTNIRGSVTLFGKTVTRNGTAPGGSAPGKLAFIFTAPSQGGKYTGEFTVEAYY